MIIYEIPNFIKLSYDPGQKYILFDWLDFYVTLPEFKLISQKSLECSVENNCYFHVYETSKVKSILRPEVIEWFSKIWAPELVACGVKTIFTILPGIGLALISTRSWQASVSTLMTIKNFNALPEAEAAVKEFQVGILS